MIPPRVLRGGMRAVLGLALLLVLPSLAAATVITPPCGAGQWTHTYPLTGSNGHVAGIVAVEDIPLVGDGSVEGIITAEDIPIVADSNLADCDGDGEGGDFDGDYDTGNGGAFFGYGPWAQDEACGYGLREHGVNVMVNDFAFGSNVLFVTAADDQTGPLFVPDPVRGGVVCETDGAITPGDPAVDPTADADDCMSATYVGTGVACGAGGDGGYWVLLATGAMVAGGVNVHNVPLAGTITAY